jgi:hypothetical protein
MQAQWPVERQCWPPHGAHPPSPSANPPTTCYSTSPLTSSMAGEGCLAQTTTTNPSLSLNSSQPLCAPRHPASLRSTRSTLCVDTLNTAPRRYVILVSPTLTSDQHVRA